VDGDGGSGMADAGVADGGGEEGNVDLLSALAGAWRLPVAAGAVQTCRAAAATSEPKPLDRIPAVCLAQSLQTGRRNPCGLDGIPARRSAADHRILVRSCLVPSLGFEPSQQQAAAPPGWVGGWDSAEWVTGKVEWPNCPVGFFIVI
jgi:hypothetical protein